MKTELEKMFDIEFPFLSKIPFIRFICYECFFRGFFKGKNLIP